MLSGNLLIKIDLFILLAELLSKVTSGKKFS